MIRRSGIPLALVLKSQLGHISVSADKTMMGRKNENALFKGPPASNGARKTESAIPFSMAIFLPDVEVVVRMILAEGWAFRSDSQKGVMAITSPAEAAWSHRLYPIDSFWISASG